MVTGASAGAATRLSSLARAGTLKLGVAGALAQHPDHGAFVFGRCKIARVVLALFVARGGDDIAVDAQVALAGVVGAGLRGAGKRLGPGKAVGVGIVQTSDVVDAVEHGLGGLAVHARGCVLAGCIGGAAAAGAGAGGSTA